MTKVSDGRISNFHRQIYDWLVEILPNTEIELEKLIPSTGQRIDIYIPILNLAIECDGVQHRKPVGHFIKTQEQWKNLIELDKKKDRLLYENGITLIRIPDNHSLKSSKDLRSLILGTVPNPTPYKDIFLDESKHTSSSYVEAHREALRGQYDQRYQKLKESRREAYRALKIDWKEIYKKKKEYIENSKE